MHGVCGVGDVAILPITDFTVLNVTVDGAVFQLCCGRRRVRPDRVSARQVPTSASQVRRCAVDGGHHSSRSGSSGSDIDRDDKHNNGDSNNNKHSTGSEPITVNNPDTVNNRHQGLNNANDDEAGVNGTEDVNVDGVDGDENASQPIVPASASQPAATNCTRAGTSTPPATDTVFLGEAFSLTYMLHDVLAPMLAADVRRFRRRLHLPLLTNRPPPKRAEIVARQREHLNKLGLAGAGADASAESPVPTHDDALLDYYFEHFHPAFPVVHCAQFRAAVSEGTASLLVLNAVRMVATTIYDASLLIDAAGRPLSRHALRRIYYQRAKALYDGNLEPDKYDAIAGAFLMSFWWDGPDDQQDSWHWLGVATSLAQSLGMHRSMRHSGASTQKMQAWRRLWWSIRVRDTLVSGSIGRPLHASDLSCDVELLTVDDVRDAIAPTASEEAILYPVAMARLSTIFSDILTSRYAAPGKGCDKNSTTRASIEAALDAFRADIPPALNYTGITPGTPQKPGRGLWAATLLTAFDYASILLCRPSRSIDGREQMDDWGNTHRAAVAANEVTRLIEDILSANVARVCQIHTIPALFNALAMHIWELGTSPTPLGRQLAESRCRTCILGLDVLQVSWPVGGWVHRFFASTMDRLQAKGRLTTTSPSGDQHQSQGRESTSIQDPSHNHGSTTATTNAAAASAPGNDRLIQQVDPLQAQTQAHAPTTNGNAHVQAWPPAAGVLPPTHPTMNMNTNMNTSYPAYSLVYMNMNTTDEPFGAGADMNGSTTTSSNPRNWQLMPPASDAALPGDFMHDLFLFEDTGDGDPPLQLADFFGPLQSFS